MMIPTLLKELPRCFAFHVQGYPSDWIPSPSYLLIVALIVIMISLTMHRTARKQDYTIVA
jgi:hypothetical protein